MKNEEILNEIKKITKKFDIKDNVDLNTDIKSLGIDSLDLMDLILDIENKYKVTIPDEKLLKIEKIKDLVEILRNLIK